MPLVLYNSLTRRKEEVAPIQPGLLRMYACGPTVYNYAHIGNARMAVAFDLLRRVALKSCAKKVLYVSNITDVDDKIIAAGRETGESISGLTARFARIYNQDMKALGVRVPDVQPRATKHIHLMIALIQRLIDKGHAYADGTDSGQSHVLFNVPSFPAYGRLSNRSRDEQVAGARVEVAPYKKDAADFILWKPAGKGEPGWDSPWGRGRPGWHIECSAMAESHLGLPFDIHGGGADLKFPHHENEIAQSCCAHGREDEPEGFARMWVHNGFVTVNGEKMSKSLGNVQLVHDLIGRFPGEVLRLALLSAHYRQPLDWSDSLLHSCRATLDRLYRDLYELKDVKRAHNKCPPEVMAALNDDLNTPRAWAALLDLRNAPAAPEEKKAALLAAGKVMGLLQADPAVWLGIGQARDSEAPEIEALLARRQEARQSRDFAEADRIRDRLSAMGIAVEDSPAGPTWRKIG